MTDARVKLSGGLMTSGWASGQQRLGSELIPAKPLLQICRFPNFRAIANCRMEQQAFIDTII